MGPQSTSTRCVDQHGSCGHGAHTSRTSAMRPPSAPSPSAHSITNEPSQSCLHRAGENGAYAQAAAVLGE